MLNSLRLYSKYFLASAFSPAGKYVMLDLRRYFASKGFFNHVPEADQSRQKISLDHAVAWLINSQKAGNDGGMGSYHLINKWSSSYPETTGYIIPTLIQYGQVSGHAEATDAAIGAADFLLNIQKGSGGWQGGRIGDDKPEIVFNTGQVIRGMIAVYRLTGNGNYLDSAVKAGNWLAEIQDQRGFWEEHALMGQARVYDTFVDAPLIDLYGLTGSETFKTAAVRNLEWVAGEKMLDNGWFEDCDNTVKRNARPILHTIAYTLDGLIDCGMMLKEDKYINSARKGAEKLLGLFLAQGFLNGRYDRRWNGSEYMICTGCAQMAIVWLKLFRLTGMRQYLEGAEKMLDLLIFIQSRRFREPDATLGAIPGSFPVWGRYEPFAFPNWATKFFCDALMLKAEVDHDGT